MRSLFEFYALSHYSLNLRLAVHNANYALRWIHVPEIMLS